MVLTTDILSKIRDKLENTPSIQAAYLHGSMAKGTARPDSDIDIALLMKRGESLPTIKKLMLAAELESLLGRKVDLGELSTRNLIYIKEVIHHGKEIFTNDRFETDLFMATSLSMYAELQEQRKEIIDAYSAK